MDILLIILPMVLERRQLLFQNIILILNENDNEVREVAITNFAMKKKKKKIDFYLSKILWNIG